MFEAPSLPFSSPPAMLVTLLPGTDRKRTDSLYRYRLTYRNPQAQVSGCVMTWDVQGGRLPYQVALERDDAGNLRLHCTCADAIYRAEGQGRFCKHVHGLLDFGRRPCSLGQEQPAVQCRGA